MQVDLLFIVGTSLVVGPANQLPMMVSSKCVRVLVNNEKVGEFMFEFNDEDSRDLFIDGKCDDSFLALIDKLGWLKDLEENIDHLAPSGAEMVKKLLLSRV